MKLNERYSEMFELRLSAINERFEAQKEQIEKYNSNEGNNPKSSELMSQLNEWYQAEMSSMDSEKKKITKGWFTSIDTIRKIKRDLEIAAEMKKGFSLKVPSKGHLKQSEDSSSIYGIIAKSLVSPSNKRLDSGNKRSYFRENSPMSSPNDNSVHSHTKIISDPNVRSMKMKQGESLSRRNDDMAKSLEQADFSKSYKGLAEDNYKGQLEISDAKRNIVNEIDDGIHKRQNEDLIEVIKNNQIFTEDPYFASPPHPSIDSSNLYQISPTSIKRQSKPNSSNKPRSTLKSDSAIEEKAKPDDLIWIKDQSKPKIQGVVPGESSQGLDIDKKSSGNSIQRLQTFPKDDFSKTPFSRGSLQEALSPEVPILTHQNLDQNRLDSIFDPNFKIFQSPQESQRKPLIDDEFKGEKDNDRVKSDSNVSSNSQGRITQKTNFTPLMRNEFDATHPPLSSTEGLDSLKKELEKIPRATEYSQPDHSSQKDQLTREGSKRAHGRAQNYEQEDYLNDLTQGIGFDSQVIKNDFEDTKKSTYNLDDFASMSDSERELQKQAERMKKLDVVSEEILDMIFTDTISDIIQMLENENMDFEREIASGYNGQIYLQDGQDQVAPQQIILQRRGIRVNFNAVKEYISLLINFIKGTTSLPKEARQR
jgi:hypothetical protein